MDVSDMFVQEATVERMTGRDSAGDPLYADGLLETFMCRAEFSTWYKKRFHAKEADIFNRLSTLEVLAEGDRVWPPNADTTNVEASITIDRIDEVYDVDGCRVHFIIYL